LGLAIVHFEFSVLRKLQSRRAILLLLAIVFTDSCQRQQNPISRLQVSKS